MDIDYRWVVDEVTDGYRWVSYAGRRNRHVVKKSGVSQLLELKTWSQSTFGTKKSGVVPLLELNLMESVHF